jgi:BirA family biotin operon repressor/biotin-[acetyl-CoA-carboxylase] ligase
MQPADADRPPLDHVRLGGLAPLRVEVVATADSTNALVAERARSGEEAGLVLVAEHQQAGRGRLDRVWQTPPRAALTFSMLVDPQVPADRWPLLPLLAGFVVDTVLAERIGAAALKWPNDVLATGPDGLDRKLAGILVERVEGPYGPLAVVGIGINVSQGPDELPTDGATSVLQQLRAEVAAEGGAEADVLGARVDRTELLEQLLATWQALLPLLRRPEDLLAGYRAVCGTLGREVDVHLPGGRVHRGTALDLDSHGALVVGDGPGTLTVTAGDVVHVRLAG